MDSEPYRIRRDPKNPKSALGCIDLVFSPDDGGWYAQEFDFARKDNATRTSSKIYASRGELRLSLDFDTHRWGEWD